MNIVFQLPFITSVVPCRYNRIETAVQSPGQAYMEDYLKPAIEFIKTKIDVQKEILQVKGKLNEVLRKTQNNQAINPWSCHLCGNVPPPHSNRTVKY